MFLACIRCHACGFIYYVSSFALSRFCPFHSLPYLRTYCYCVSSCVLSRFRPILYVTILVDFIYYVSSYVLCRFHPCEDFSNSEVPKHGMITIHIEDTILLNYKHFDVFFIMFLAMHFVSCSSSTLFLVHPP